MVFVFGGIFVLSLLQIYHKIDLFHRNRTQVFQIKTDDESVKIEVNLLNASYAKSILIGQALDVKRNRILNSNEFWNIVAIISGFIFWVLILVLLGLSSKVNDTINLLVQTSKLVVILFLNLILTNCSWQFLEQPQELP